MRNNGTETSRSRARHLAMVAMIVSSTRCTSRFPVVSAFTTCLSAQKRPRTSTGTSVVVRHASSSEDSLPYFDRIGRPKTVLAPMVSQSDLPFRLLCRKYGSKLAYTQMIHAKNYGLSDDFRANHLDVYAPGQVIDETALSGSQLNCLDGLGRDFGPGGFGRYKNRMMSEEGYAEDHASFVNPVSSTVYPDEGPVVVQLAGHDPTLVADAALDIVKRTQGNVAGIDLNGGCPQKIARSGRYGAFLHEEEPELYGDVLAKIRQTVPQNIGVSAKIRLPIDETQLKERIQRIVHSGVDLITVHGRTLKENKTKVKHANWDAIRLAAQIARECSGNPDFPVIANGGIEYGSDVQKCLDHTGASAVMSSESLLENPALFATNGPYSVDDTELSPRQLFERQLNLVDEYLDLCELYPPVPGSLGKVGGSYNVVRSHVFKMIYRFCEERPDIRTKLADNSVVSIPATRKILTQLRASYEGLSDAEWQGCKSGKMGSSWYRRHREATTRVHRRGGLGSNAGSLNEATSIEEKKRIMKERLRKLKEQKKIRSSGLPSVQIGEKKTLVG